MIFVPVSNLFWFFVLLSVFYSFFLPVTPITRLARPRSESAPGNFLKFSEKANAVQPKGEYFHVEQHHRYSRMGM